MLCYRGPARFNRSTPNKTFEPISTVIMAVCSLFNRMLSSTDLIPVHLLHYRTNCDDKLNHTSLEWITTIITG